LTDATVWPPFPNSASSVGYAVLLQTCEGVECREGVAQEASFVESMELRETVFAQATAELLSPGLAAPHAGLSRACWTCVMQERAAQIERPTRVPRRASPSEIDELVLHLIGLVRVRELLKHRGASEAELEAHSAEIGRLRWRLARLVREGSKRWGA
jgi:hypothetical protein